MKIIIAGSNDFNDYNALVTEVGRVLADAIFKGYRVLDEEISIVTGSDKGAGKLGRDFANQYQFYHKYFPAQEAKYGKSAENLKNCIMIDYAKSKSVKPVLLVLGEIDGSTANLIELAEKEGFAIYKVKEC